MKKILIVLTLSMWISILAFSMPLTDKKSTIFIAHRGVPAVAPEHTFLSYDTAIDMRADYIEIDLRMTKDGHLVSVHDRSIDKISTGTGEVAEMNLKEIKQFDVMSENHDSKQKILSLQEIFERYGDGANYYIETRFVNGQSAMEESLLGLIDQYNLSDHVIIQSFEVDSLKKIKELDSKIPLVQLLFEDDLTAIDLHEIKKYAYAIGPYAKKIDKSFITKAQEAGLEVHVWFDAGNESELIREILGYNVDGIFTDHVGNAREIYESEQKVNQY